MKKITQNNIKENLLYILITTATILIFVQIPTCVANENSGDLDISLQIVEKLYDLYEPVPLNISLFSETETNLVISILITDTKQNEIIYSYLKNINVPAEKTISLKDITDDPKWTPVDGGEYIVEAMLSNDKGMSVRDDVIISVIEAPSDKESDNRYENLLKASPIKTSSETSQKKITGTSDFAILTDSFPDESQSINANSKPLLTSSIGKAIAFNATCQSLPTRLDIPI